MSGLNKLTIKEAAQGLRVGNFTSVELTQACLDAIKEKDGNINAFLTVDVEGALQQARAADEARSLNPGGLKALAGIPVALKDNFSTKGLRTTAGSKTLKDYIPPYDAAVVKVLRDQHVVILGKTNLDEFAMGASTENSAYGPTKNPHDLTRVPGGSSGGSAAAVAANMCVYALGTDTGGSVRQPAALTGTVGLKPTYGAVSRYGIIAMASSLDQVGPITKSVGDAERVLQTIACHDPHDATSFQANRQPPTAKGQLRIGVPKEYLIEGISEEVEKEVRSTVDQLSQAGHEIEEISLPHTSYALATYYVIVPSEVSSNLARYHGIRYSKAREKFGPEVIRRIMLGTYALSSGYHDQYYGKASKARALIKKDFEEAFRDVDVIVTPTTPTTAFKIGEKQDPLSMYLADIFTVSANLAGIPGISLPVGVDSENLPIGLQILGPQKGEAEILSLAHQIESMKNENEK